MSIFIGRADFALGYARLAQQLEATGRYDSFAPGWSGIVKAAALLIAGDSEGSLGLLRNLAASRTSVSSRAAWGFFGLLWFLPGLGRADEAALNSPTTPSAPPGTGDTSPESPCRSAPATAVPRGQRPSTSASSDAFGA